MPRPSYTFTFLGTGASMGVPIIGCDCPVCTSVDPRNQRYRCSVVIRMPQGNLLIDTPPELRLQLLRAKVPLIHAVLFTHYHADHIFGLDDLRPLPRQLGGPVPMYCNHETERFLRQSFAYAFSAHVESLPAGFLPKLTFNNIEDAPFQVLGETVTPIPLAHAHFHVLGFRIRDVAYCTDVNKIPRESWPRLEGLKVLILDALRHKPHPGHFSIEESLEVVERVRPEKTYFTHMSHDLEHAETNRMLPRGVELAYDGLTFEF